MKIAIIKNFVKVYEKRYDSEVHKDEILGTLENGDVVTVIQTFKTNFNESLCITRFGLGFVQNNEIMLYEFVQS